MTRLKDVKAWLGLFPWRVLGHLGRQLLRATPSPVLSSQEQEAKEGAEEAASC